MCKEANGLFVLRGAVVGKRVGTYHISNLAMSLFVDGELDEIDRRRVADHLDSCGCCRKTVAAYRRLDHELETAGKPTFPVPASVTYRLIDTIDARPTGLVYRLMDAARSMPAAAGTLTAALLLIIGVSYMYRGSGPGTASPSPAPTSSTQAGGGSAEPLSAVRGRLQVITDRRLASNSGANAGPPAGIGRAVGYTEAWPE